MPSAAQDNELSADQPIKFKEEYLVSMNLGSALPFGANLKDNFTSGMNIQADVKTPFSFSGFNLLGNFAMFTLTGDGEHSDKFGDYSVTSFGVSIAKDVSILNLHIGTGLALASGTTLYNPWDDYSMTTLYMSGGLSYTLPLSGLLEKVADGKMKNLQLALNGGGMIIFGGPDPNGTSDMLNFGLAVKYPFLF